MSRKSMLSSSICSRKRRSSFERGQILIGRDVAEDVENFFSDFSGGHSGAISINSNSEWSHVNADLRK